jgi:hypothetical protein
LNTIICPIVAWTDYTTRFGMGVENPISGKDDEANTIKKVRWRGYRPPKGM